MKNNRIMIAAPRSGSGKTILTCGLLAYLKDLGKNVRSYKCGPDYIDPMFHRTVIGVPGGNLDTFFSDEKEINSMIAAADCDAAVIEGAMGIYDGISGGAQKGSCYDVAKATGTPILLIIDVKGMGTTMLSVIKGLLLDDKENLIRGIVLNRISERYFQEIKPLVENTLQEISDQRGVSVKLAGGIPNDKLIKLESRHLGLMMPDEIGDWKDQVNRAKDLIAGYLDMDLIHNIMGQAKMLDRTDTKLTKRTVPGVRNVTIVTARDEAFCFYYEENLRLLEQYGITVKEFSPLHDERIPEDADGILLGGGYPELFAEKLSRNTSMRQSIHNAITDGMPCLAECGGFMYLMDKMADEQGHAWSMVRVIPGSSENTGKLGRFGYITITGKEQASLIDGLSIRGHEFHYYDSTNNGKDAIAVKPGSGKSWECIHAGDNYVWGYPHLYYPSCPQLIERFADKMREYRKNREEEHHHEQFVQVL